jgi:hypothetical protein
MLISALSRSLPPGSEIVFEVIVPDDLTPAAKPPFRRRGGWCRRTG